MYSGLKYHRRSTDLNSIDKFGFFPIVEQAVSVHREGHNFMTQNIIYTFEEFFLKVDYFRNMLDNRFSVREQSVPEEVLKI